MRNRVIDYVKKNELNVLLLFAFSVIVFAGIVLMFGPFAFVSFGRVGNQRVSNYGALIILAGVLFLLLNLYYNWSDKKKGQRVK